MSKDLLDSFVYTYVEKSSTKIFVILHGTGGDEHDLIPLAEAIDPTYSILSLRGNVQEHGLNRFFERYADGSFNLENLRLETQKLKLFLDRWLELNKKSLNFLTFLGYSNGANFALSYLFLYSGLVKKALLFHPILPFVPEKQFPLDETHVFITHGKHDPYSTPDAFLSLQKVLKKISTDVHICEHEGGHELRPEEIDNAKNFLHQL